MLIIRNTLLLAMTIYSGLICGQNNKQIIDGSKPFILNFNSVEVYKDGDNFNKEYKTNIQITFIPNHKTGEGKLCLKFSDGKECLNINNIRKTLKDNIVHYMANDIEDHNIFFVWSYITFIYCEKEMYYQCK